MSELLRMEAIGAKEVDDIDMGDLYAVLKTCQRRLAALETFKAKAIELYPSLAEDWKRIERSSLEHAQKFEDTKEDGS